MSAKTRTARDERMARRWGVSHRTILNWRVAAEKAEVPCPMDATNPDDFLEWYRAVIGREPAEKLKEAAARITAETGEGTEVRTATEIDRAPMDLIEKTLERLGRSRTLARAMAEEEMAATLYEQGREEGLSSGALAGLRKNWADAAAMVRDAKKGDDAVEVALELLKEVMRREWEPRERERRKRLSGKELGIQARERLLAVQSVVEWEREWDRVIELGLREES